ncbi:hypothetical protein ACSHUI_00190 [Bacillus subtilis]|uniref:hypothetical protein n=1 Tax=Bacillus subtilis TaxID=1423 RepID=UPI00279E7861|nr:hypothetical protein Goe26_01780 [Bacillus phage vB_BsuM-Goe26]
MNKSMYIVIGLRSEAELFKDGLIQWVSTIEEAKELRTNFIDDQGCVTVIITETKSFAHVLNGKVIEHETENRKSNDFFGGLVK